MRDFESSFYFFGIFGRAKRKKNGRVEYIFHFQSKLLFILFFIGPISYHNKVFFILLKSGNSKTIFHTSVLLHTYICYNILTTVFILFYDLPFLLKLLASAACTLMWIDNRAL